jgi:hypothetical protein
MNRSFCETVAFVAAAAVILPLSYPAVADSSIILKSTRSFDRAAHTATLPLREGWVDGRPVWYIITDASDANEARALGVVYSPDLANIGLRATQHVVKHGSQYLFEAAPDFSPQRTYVASAGGFPPKSASPGSVATGYSPFVRVDGLPGVLNAPIVASGAGGFDVTRHSNTEDRVIAIDTHAKTVTLALARGFVDGRLIDYLSTEASDPVAASVERATYTPKLKEAASSSAIPIGVVVNGPRNSNDGQGLAYLALDTPLGENATPQNLAQIGSPFNILSLAPDMDHPYAQNGYSPLWNVEVLPAGKAQRIKDFATFAGLGPKPAGFVVNCPVVAYE